MKSIDFYLSFQENMAYSIRSTSNVNSLIRNKDWLLPGV